MTVANSNMEWSITCDGSTESATGVVLDAYLYDDDEIEVILKTIATGAETTLTKTTDYTVSGVPGATAAVKTVSNYTSASAIYVRRTAVLTQTDDLVTGDPIPDEVMEKILDKDAMALQVINNKAARAIQLSKTSDLTDLTVIPTASKIIGFNAAGTALMLYDTSTDSGDASLADLLSSSGFGTIIYPQEVQVGSTGIRVISGTGTPEASVTANVGSIYLRTDGSTGTSVYRKESGSGNTGWTADNAITEANTVKGSNDGMIVKWASQTTVDIDANEIILADSNNIPYRTTSVNLTADTTGSGANGLDTGAIANSTQYYLWVIYNGSTTASLISLSKTAPTMPSGYTYKALVGFFYNNTAGQIKHVLTYNGKTFESTAPFLGSNIASTSTGATVATSEGSLITGLDMGTMTLGDKIGYMFTISGTKGATGGLVRGQLVKTSGTGVVKSFSGINNHYPTVYMEANETEAELVGVGYLHASTAGTMVFQLNGHSKGSTVTSATVAVAVWYESKQ